VSDDHAPEANCDLDQRFVDAVSREDADALTRLFW
jgi:hypothetical protein